MEAMIDELEKALDTQIANVTELEQVLRLQRESLLARDVEGILESVTTQGQTLERIQQIEAQRLALVAKLAAAVGLAPRITLAQLAEKLGPAEAEIVIKRREELRSRLETIRHLNQENHRHIQHALEIVQGLVGALTGSGATKRTYEASGNLKPQSQLRTLVDQTT